MNTWLFSRLEFIDQITPPHDVDDAQKMRGLKASLQTLGWIGPPIIVIGCQALTGTHRLAAAKMAGIQLVPVLELSALQDNVPGTVPTEVTRESIKSIISSLPASIREQYAASISDPTILFEND
jgi:hypothetical protein